MSEMTCPECGGWLEIKVDGRRMSEAELLSLPWAPKSIKRRMIHKRWCTRLRADYTGSGE